MEAKRHLVTTDLDMLKHVHPPMHIVCGCLTSRIMCLSSPTPNPKILDNIKWDQLNATTWGNHCDWPIKANHIFLWTPLGEHSMHVFKSKLNFMLFKKLETLSKLLFTCEGYFVCLFVFVFFSSFVKLPHWWGAPNWYSISWWHFWMIANLFSNSCYI